MLKIEKTCLVAGFCIQENLFQKKQGFTAKRIIALVIFQLIWPNVKNHPGLGQI